MYRVHLRDADRPGVTACGRELRIGIKRTYYRDECTCTQCLAVTDPATVLERQPAKRRRSDRGSALLVDSRPAPLKDPGGEWRDFWS